VHVRVALLLAVALVANPPSGFIPEALLRPLPGIKRATHEKCVEWWKDWAAQHHGDMKGLTDVERHCVFVHYLRTCGLHLLGYEMPGSASGAGVPSFDNPNRWDNETADLYESRCFEFEKDEDSPFRGTVIGETPRVVRLVPDQEEHVKRRLLPMRRVHVANIPGLVRPASKVEQRRTGAR
jgi:hypothetical protein